MLRNFAKEIRGSEDKPGREWLKRWRQRHQDEIIYALSRFDTRGASDLRVTENEGQVQGEGKNYNNWYSRPRLY